TVAGAQAYHPTFLYESLWDLGVAGLVIWADRRFRLGRGRAFALYAMAYTAGRLWIEALRIDHANRILGLRLNIWTSILVFAGPLPDCRRPGGRREPGVQRGPEPVAAAPAEPAAGGSAEGEPAEPADGGDAAGPAVRDTAEDRAADPGGGTADSTAGGGAEPAGSRAKPAGAEVADHDT